MEIILQEKLTHYRKLFFILILTFVFGSGTFNTYAQLCFTPAKTYPVDNYPQYVVSADFNGDGILDLATANNQGTNTLSILLGNGDGSFGTPLNISQSIYPFGIISADFNGDGKADLAVTNNSSANVAILLGNGDGTFGLAHTFNVDTQPRPLVSADFNGDGKLDLAVGNFGSNTISMLLGNGDGSFVTKTDFPTGAGPYSMTLGDFNKDGKPDLAVANGNSTTVSILLGNGSGGFGATTNFSTNTISATSVVTTDFNKDGNPDLAVSDATSNVAILLGDGTGDFATSVNYTMGNSPYFIVTADFDGDGNADLASANYYGNNVSVLLGNGTGGFGTAINFATNGSNPYGIISADFNRDGKADLAITNNVDHTISILLSLHAKASADTSICSGTSTNLSVSGADTYSWSPATGLNCTSCQAPTATPANTTTYFVTVAGGTCISTDSVTVTITPGVALTVNPAADTTVCSGSSVQLNAAGAVNYSWLPATNLSCSTCTNPLAGSLSDSVTYVVTGSNAQGACMATKQIRILIGGGGIAGTVTSVRDTVCAGTPGNLSLTGNSSDSILWQLSVNNKDFTDITGTKNIANYKTPPLTQTTWYLAKVGTGSCTAVTDTVQLYVPEALIASFFFTQPATSQIAFNSDSSSGNIRAYHWDFGDGQTSAEQNPTHTYSKDTTYYVCLTLYDGSNCSYTFCRYGDVTDAVHDLSTMGKWMIYPNPFSNTFVINGNELNTIVESVEVYDVLGRQIFNKNYKAQNNPIAINLTGFAQGLYYLEIKTANTNFFRPVIKQQ